jgi:peptidoglycan/LPS O-acetylase OafA/YrhL
MSIDKWSTLAGLRFVLAFIVIVNHLPIFTPAGTWEFVPKFGAFEAILGFLLISGYSIGASYQKESNGFLARRAMRIYPIYAASIILTLIAFKMENSFFPSLWIILANIFFLNQIFTTGSLVEPAWSLALEFWLYCLTPVLFKAHPSTLRRLTYASFIAYVGYTCGRTIFHWDYYSGVGYGLNLIFLSYVWLAGLRLARDPSNARLVLKDIGAMFAIHILLALCIEAASSWKRGTTEAFFQSGIDTLVLRASTLLFVFWVFTRITTSFAGKTSTSPALRILGDVSYPLYVIHMPIFFLLKWAGLTSPTTYLLAAISAALMLYLVLDKYSQVRHRVGNVKAGADQPSEGNDQHLDRQAI